MRPRHISVSLLVCVMVITSMGLGGSASAAPAESEEQGTFQYPSDDGLEVDRALALSVEPQAPAAVIDVDPVIGAANALFDALAANEWELAPLLARLGNDPQAAFHLVRDRIGLQPYPGVLRGAQGTLAARAGNAFDRSLLLQALLEAQGQTTRLAFGELDAASASRLAERVFAPVAEPLQDASGLILGKSFADSVERRARRDYALLRPALDPYLTEASLVPPPDPATVLAHHAWVQVLEGDTWVDFDPSLADAEPGEALAAATNYADEVPAVDRQTVTLKVVAETLADGWLSEAQVLELGLDAADASGRQILLLFQPGSGDGGMLGFGDVGTSTTFAPLMLVDGVAVTGTPFETAAGGDGGGGFADFGGFGGGSSPELVGLYLDVVVSAPGRADDLRRRVLLDRVPPEVRATGAVTSDLLVPIAADEEGPFALAGVHHVMVSTGGSDPRYQAVAMSHAAYDAATDLAAPGALEALPVDAALSPMTTADQGLVVASEHVVVDSIRDMGAVAFVARPRISVVSLVPDPAMPFGLDYTVDLLSDPIELVAAGDAAALDLARARAWYGALESALETESVIRLAPAFGAGRELLDSASLRLDSSEAASNVATAASLDAAAPTALRQALAGGLLAIIPDPTTPDAWWTVDPADGSTRSVLDPGLGMAGVRGPGGGAKPITPVDPSSPGGNPPGGNPPSAPKPPDPSPPKPPARTPMRFPDEFVPAKQKPKPRGGVESQVVDTSVAIPTIQATSFWSRHGVKVVLGSAVAGLAAYYAFR